MLALKAQMGTGEPNDSSPGRRPESLALAGAAGVSDPEHWVDEHGDYLYSYAMLRLRNPAAAQDVVQETFLAALKGHGNFAGRSAERGWLLGILKHKIMDAHRQASRERSFTDLAFGQEEENERFVADGWHQGAWRPDQGPKAWSPEPGESLDQQEFWRTLRQCLGKLPQAVCQVFLMREMDERNTSDICATLRITENNLWVMLHRARLALRRCLATNWFTR